MVAKVPSHVSIKSSADYLTLAFILVFLPNGSQLNMIPTGLTHETKTKCILGNGVVLDPKLLLEDFVNLHANGIDYEDRMLISQRCHLITAFHSKITQHLKEIRKESGIWLSPTDIAYAYKPLKMGLRMRNLHDNWSSFVDAYDRINKTCA